MARTRDTKLNVGETPPNPSGEAPANPLSAFAQQVKGVAHQAMGTVLGDEERVSAGQRMVQESQAGQHMSRAIAASERAAHAVAEALHEAGQAEVKLGQLHSDPALVASGESKQSAAGQIEEHVEAQMGRPEAEATTLNTMDKVDTTVVSLP